jgi:penicillin amidase
VDATAPDAASHAWAGYIPFDQLPQAFDPPDGVLATANGRVTLDGYRFPITLDWMAPYRTERIYKVLEVTPAKIFEASPGEILEPKPQLTPANMLALENDVYSELDHVLAQRYAYAIDHANIAPKDAKTLHQAADLLRGWNGKVDANAAAPAIVNATRTAFWPMLLIPKLAPEVAPQIAQGIDLIKIKNLSPEMVRAGSLWNVYTWGEKGTVEEEFLTTTPARWLPQGYANWNDFLAKVVLRGLRDEHAPSDLSTWQEGKAFPLDIEHPIFGMSSILQRLVGVPTGTGRQAQSGDRTTVKQVGLAFGPSERFTADLSDPDRTTLNLVLGQSGNPASPWYMDQFPSWLHGKTYALPFTPAAAQSTIIHTLTLNPR